MEPVDSRVPTTYRYEEERNSWTDDYINLGQLCRICGAPSDFLMPIFDGESHDRLDLKIHMHLPIQVDRNDILPVQSCFNCVTTIQSWHNLFLACQEADLKFQTMLGTKNQVPNRHSSVLISPNSAHAHSLPSHHATLTFPKISQNPPYLEVTTTIPHAHLDQSTSTSCIQELQPSTELLNGMRHYSLPQEETFEQTFNSSISSGLASSVPTEFTNNVISHIVHEKFSSSPIHTHSEQHVAHVSTQTENDGDDKSSQDETKFNSKKSVIGKKIFRQGSTLKGKKDASFDMDSGRPPPLPAERENSISEAPHRVSAIQSVGSRNDTTYQETNCTRLKSVLVRNESVRPSVLSSDNTDRPHLVNSKIEIVESGVIREHRHSEVLKEPSKSTMVSVLRPTCLRRAPTKIGVIETTFKEPEIQVGVKDINQCAATSYPMEERDYYDSAPCHGDDFEDVHPEFLDPPSLSTLEEQNKIGDPSQVCFHCKKFIANPILLLSHEKSHMSDSNPPTTFICKFCSIPEVSISSLHSHYASHETEVERLQRNQSNRKAHLCKQCGIMCTTEERLSMHQRLHAEGVEPFRHECKTCGQQFNTRSKLSVHLWSHALKPSLKTFKCHICGKGFVTKSAVMEHRLKHTDEERSRAFKCVICGMAFGNNTLLGKHRSTHSEEELARPFQCTFCGKSFARNHTLQIHHLSHTNVKSHVCNQCGKCFKMRNSLIQHMRTHQDPSCLPTYPCQLCGKIFKIKSRLRDHLRLHNGDKPYKCSTCGKCFHKITALHTHEVSHTERRPYMCDICGKAFKWSKNLRQHTFVHISTGKSSEKTPCSSEKTPCSSEKTPCSSENTVKLKPSQQPCQCEICGKQLSTKSSLRQHMANIHSDGEGKQIKSTICSICGKVLSNAGGLLRHMKITHGGVKAFKCDICDKEYSTKVARDDHRRSHTGERPYTCSICNKSFTSLSNLHIHRLIHSEDRPHKCTYCDKQFKRRAHLVPHLRTHTGEKPYVCNICSRGFAQSNDLHKHRLTHSNDKAYACHCGVAFRVKRDLTRHQAKHHPAGSLQSAPSQNALLSSGAISETHAPREQLILLTGQHSSVASVSTVPEYNVPVETYGNFVATPSVVVLNTGVLASRN
ncbi:zinc finger protein 569-like [Thrips palmi]|uniref:Zinc finger protein 569-like n=1 Tax=Thrips palmi TaxID=161013 RepID=A0A6P8YE95_THRPL|nr:zinc finger protein 569-like [Thrips palmi]XP_034232167.1 zinc finger protein 569-like [Thrips palmi]